MVAVIAAYRPELASVRSLARGLQECGIDVLVADDASPVTFDRTLAELEHEPIRIKRFATNRGIARSLNAGLAFANERGASWLLTMDQDSALQDDYVQDLLSSLPEGESDAGDRQAPRVGAIGAAHIHDARAGFGYPVRRRGPVTVTDEVMQSGTLWSVTALNEVGGFDEVLAIDAVDAAACLALRKSGYLITVAPGTRLTHHLGHTRPVTVLGRQVLSTGHGPSRRETMMRNRLRLLPAEFSQSPTQAFRTMRRLALNTALAVTVEEGRWANAKGSLRGLFPRQRRT